MIIIMEIEYKERCVYECVYSIYVGSQINFDGHAMAQGQDA